MSISLRTKLLELLKNNPWIEDVREENLQVSIWNTSIVLISIILKHQTMSVAPGISISVEDGTVGKISLSVPLWYGFGRVEAAIEAVDLVLKLDFNEPVNINNLTGSNNTMDVLKTLDDELKLLGCSNRVSWFNYIIETIVGRALALIFSQIYVVAKRLNIILLIPQTDSTMFTLRMFIESLSFETPFCNAAVGYEGKLYNKTHISVVSKEFKVRNMRLYCRKSEEIVFKNKDAYMDNLRNSNLGLILSPVQLSVSSDILQSSFRNPFSVSNGAVLLAEIVLGQIEVNTSLGEIKLLMELMDHVQFHMTKIRLFPLRKSIIGNESRENKRLYNVLLWQFAIKAVIEKLRLGETRINSDKLSIALLTLKPKLKYSELLRKCLTKAIGANEADKSYREGLSKLERHLHPEDIKFIRNFTIDKLLGDGYSPLEICLGLKTMYEDEYSAFLKRYRLPNSGNDRDNSISFDELHLKHRSHPFTTKLFFTAESVSIRFFNEDLKTGVPEEKLKERQRKHRFHVQEDKFRHKIFTGGTSSPNPIIRFERICTLVISCVNIIVESAEEGDNTYTVMVGAVQFFGLENFKLICLGNPEVFDNTVEFRSRYDVLDADYSISMNLRILKHFVDMQCQLGTKRISKVFVSDISGRVSQALFKPSPQRIFMELKLQQLDFFWHGVSIKMLQHMTSLFQGTSKLVVNRTDLNSSSDLSELTCKFYTNGHCVVEEKFRMSIEVVISSVRFAFGLAKQHNRLSRPSSEPINYLELAVQKLYLCTGDYLENTLPRVKHRIANDGYVVEDYSTGNDSEYSDSENSSLEDTIAIQYDPMVQAAKVIRDERNALVRPRLLTIEGACVQYSTTKNVIMSPWNVCTIWIPSFSKSHEDFTDNRFDVYCADLKMLIDTKDIVNILKVFEVSKMYSAELPPKASAALRKFAPRFKEFASLSVLYFKLNLHHLDMALVDDKANENLVPTVAILTSALQRYGNGIIGDLEDPVINSVHRNMAERRFRNAGISFSATMLALDGFRQELSNIRSIKSDKMSAIVSKALSQMNLNLLVPQHQNVLLKLTINRVAIKMHQLTYDYRFLVTLDNMTLYDNSRSSLFSIRRNHSKFDDMNFFSSNDPLLKDSLKRYGISFELVKKDYKHSFGSGGVPRASIVNITDSSTWPENVYSVSVNAHDLSVEFDSFSVAQIFAEVERIRTKVSNREVSHFESINDQKLDETGLCSNEVLLNRDFQSQRFSLEDLPYPSKDEFTAKWHFCLALNLEEFACVLSNNDKAFSFVRIQRALNHTQLDYSNNFMADIVVDNVEVIDLSSLGKLRRHIMWKGETNEAEELPMLFCSVNMSEASARSIVISTHFLRINAVCRFIYEAVEYVQCCIYQSFVNKSIMADSRPPSGNLPIYASGSDSDDDYGSTMRAPPVSQASKESLPIMILLFSTDNQIHIPRSSMSNDSMCAIISTIQLSVGNTYCLVAAPVAEKVSWEGRGHLYYDVDYNIWRRSFNGTMEDDDELPFFPCAPGDSTPSNDTGTRINIVASHIHVFTTIEPLQKGKPYSKFYFSHLTSVLFEDGEDYLIENNGFGPSHGEVVQGGYVRSQSKEWGYLDLKQRWEKNTREHFNLHVVVDIGEKAVKVLLADTKDFARLSVVASHCEYHMFLGLWFENVAESPQYLHDAVDSFFPPLPFNDHDVEVAIDNLKAYGSQPYLEFMLGRPCSFELLLVRAEVMLCCALDTNHYKMDIPMIHRTSGMVQVDREKAFELQLQGKKHSVGGNDARHKISNSELKSPQSRRVIPFMDVRAAGVILCVRNFDDVIRLFISGETLEAYDVSSSKHKLQKVAIPLVLRVSKRLSTEEQLVYDPDWPSLMNFSYGFPDMTFGFCQDAPTTHTMRDVPFKLTLLSSTPSNWMTINIGVDMSDINVYKLDVPLVASDFFSIYFRYAEFGHPGVATYYSYHPSKFPYGGLDLRIFVTQPHFSFLYSDVRVSTPALILEAEKGFSFRYIYDTEGAERYEFSAYDLAAVLVKRYRAPSIYRGARGCSGSGRGLRTTLEHLNLHFVHHVNAQSGGTDMKLDILAGNNTSFEDSGIMNINAQWNGTHNIVLSEPTCLRPIKRAQDCQKPTRTIEFVTCYEDILFCLTVLKTIFAIKDFTFGVTGSDPSSQKPLMLVWTIRDLRFMLVDNVLGMHLPLFQFLFDDIASAFARNNHDFEAPTDLLSKNDFSDLMPFSNQNDESPSSCTEDKLFLSISALGEYFNSLRKCWEPLCEKIKAEACYELSPSRGKGFSLRSENAIHLNFSGALVRALLDAIRTFEVKEVDVFHEHVSDIQRKLLDQGSHNGFDWIDEMETKGSHPKHPTSGQFEEGLTKRSLLHLPSSIDPKLRVGFSILNLTGQPVRYLQDYGDGKRVIQYINDGERGLLNFVATQSVLKNSRPVEESFDVQQESAREFDDTRNRKTGGNHVTLQVSGFQWLVKVQVDELGVQCKSLNPILGRTNPTQNFTEDMKKYLKLVVEVTPYCGGRMLTLRSAFSIRNNSNHALKIKAKRFGDDKGSDANSYFILKAGTDLHLPLTFLHKNFVVSGGKSLGSLFVKPIDAGPIVEELGKDDTIDSEYSTDPINLLQIATSKSISEINDGLNENLVNDLDDDSLLYSRNGIITQLYCPVSHKSITDQAKERTSNGSDRQYSIKYDPHNLVKYPPFCYCVEVISSNVVNFTGAAEFNIVVHPPFTIENLLSMGAFFELVHHDNKERILWSSYIEPGKMIPVHTVNLDEPLDLMITLRYCRSSEGVLIHVPLSHANRGKGFAKQLKRTLEGFLEEGEKEEISTLVLTDSVGQKLRLHVENNEGGGGQKNIVVYCPYWIVNSTQYVYRIREEGEMELPAGTKVNDSKDGTRPIPHNFFSNAFDGRPVAVRSPMKPFTSPLSHNRGLIKSSDGRKSGNVSFPGLPGPFHNLEIPTDGLEWELLNDISFHKTVEHAYMFNFKDESTLLSINKKVKLQLEDSDWSRSFSLDSVGVNQALVINHPELGVLEVGFKISLAPGKLSKYTKIIRFLPRFTFVNRLPVGIRVIQADGFGEEGQESRRHEKIVTAGHAKTYHLPVLFGERKLLMKIDGPWQTTVPISIDHIGFFSLEVHKHFDLASIPHVNTRGAPEYSVVLPSNTTIGLAFETDWGEENIVVKSLQIGSFAARETDIKVGDVLIAIDEIPVSAKQFEHVMALIKSNLAQHSVTIKLRTIEEKLRIIRESAILEKRNSERKRTASVAATPKIFSPIPLQSQAVTENGTTDGHTFPEVFPIRVEFRPVDSSVMVVVSPLSVQDNVEYKIENRSGCFCLFYKQKGIVGNSWATILPGETKPYVWEDPFKPHKLLVHVGDNILSPPDTRNGKALRDGVDFGEKGKGDDSLSIYLTYLTGVASDSAVIINLDEIGSSEILPIHKDGKLSATIKSEGPTKILSVTPQVDEKDYKDEINFCGIFCRYQIGFLKNLIKEFSQSSASLVDLRGTLVRFHNDFKSQNDFKPAESPRFPILFEPLERFIEGSIDQLHQLEVEIFEAKELPPIVAGKLEDTYCKLYVRNSEKMNFVERSLSQAYYTYVCDQTLQPSWLKQRFVFNVPADAAEEYRGYNLRILVKAKSLIGMDPTLAKLDVPFSCLKDEKPIEGWFPLRPTRGTVLATNVSGSIRLRLHWIHSEPKFLSHWISSLQRRINNLELFLQNDQLISCGDATIQELPKKTIEKHPSDLNDRLVVVNDAATLFGQHSPIRPSPENADQSLLSPSIDLNDGDGIFSDSVAARQLKSKHCFEGKYEYWFRVCQKFTELHKLLRATLERNSAFQECSRYFIESFDRECLRNYVHVYTQKGRLHVIPAQITNLPELNHNLHIKVSYGKETFTTSSKPYGPSITWSNGENIDGEMECDFNISDATVDANLHSEQFQSVSREIAFDIDMLNVRGTLRFRVMAETFPKYQEVARVEIPISSILDCCCILPKDGMYEAWFPLTKMTERTVATSDIAVQSFESKTEQFQFGDYDQSLMRIRLQWESEYDQNSNQQKAKDQAIFYSRMQIPSFSLSLVDSDHARAVMLATIIGIELRRGVTREHTDLGVNITDLHVDNQLPDSYCPVIVAPTTVKFPQPVVRVHVRKNNVISKKNLSCYRTIQMVVQELDVKLEQQTVLASWELVKTLLSQKRQSDSSAVLDSKLFDNLEMTNLLPDNTLSSPFVSTGMEKQSPKKSNNLLRTFQSPQKGDLQAVKNILEDAEVLKLYIENFSISSIKINVSFFTTPQHIVEHYRKGAKADLRNERALGIFSAISFFLWQVGEVVLDLTSSISDAPIYFNGFQAAYLFKTALDIQETLLEHYLHNALGQLYKIVGSLDLVGNPIGLLSSLGIGVHDFFYEPAHALINNPTEIGKIGKGVVKGTVSLVSNTTDGFLGTGTTITRSVGRGFAKLSMDSSFLKAREKLQKPPSTLGETVTRPMKDVGNGFYYGVVGLVKVPYNSVKRHGAVGFVPGVAKGVAGLAADPIVGILDAVTHSGDAFRGILKSTNKEHEATAVRIRFSELFGVDGRLLPYSHNIAFGTQIIQSLSKTPIAASNKGVLRTSADSRHRSESVSKLAMTPNKRESSLSSIPNSTNRSSYRRNNDGSLSTTVLIGSPHPGLGSGGPHHDNHSMGYSNVKPDGLEMECVLYTAVLQKGEIVAILTTLRIVVVEISKKSNKANLPKLKWEVALNNIEACHLEEDRNRNYMLTVKHWRHNDESIPSPRTPNSGISTSPEQHVSTTKRKVGKRKSMVHGTLPFLDQAHEELIHKMTVSHQDSGSMEFLNFFDCVQTLLHLNERNWHELIVRPGHSTIMEPAVREDPLGMRHIGPWQYMLHSEVDKLYVDARDQGIVVKDLECEEWHCKGIHDINSKPKPVWLVQEENEALDAHSQVAELYSLCSELKSSLYKKHLPLQEVIRQFENGELSGGKFKEIVESIRRTWKVNIAPIDETSQGEGGGNNVSKKSGVFFETVGTVAKFATNVFKKSKPTTELNRLKTGTPIPDEGSLDGRDAGDNKSWSKLISNVQRNITPTSLSLTSHNTSFILGGNQSVISSGSDEKSSAATFDNKENKIFTDFAPIKADREKFDDDVSITSNSSQLAAFYLPLGRTTKGRKSLDTTPSFGEDTSITTSDIHPEGSLYEEAYSNNGDIKEEENPLLSKLPSRVPSRLSGSSCSPPRWEDISAENAQLHQRIDQLEQLLKQVIKSASSSTVDSVMHSDDKL